MIYNVLCMYHNPIGILNTLSMSHCIQRFRLFRDLALQQTDSSENSLWLKKWCLCSIRKKQIGIY